MDRLLSKKEAAEFFGVSQDCIDGLRARGLLTAIKIGTCVRFDEQSLRNCVESLREKKSSVRAMPWRHDEIDLAAAMARGEAALGEGRPVRSSPRE